VSSKSGSSSGASTSGVSNRALQAWVDDVARHTGPERIAWCDGSEAEAKGLIREMLASRVLHELNQKEHPGCYLHRSHLSDVARTEHLTFICSKTQEEAGPLNNWMSPADAERKVWPLFAGAMKGRTMYVVPYLMGPPGSKMSAVGVEITDSPYVVVNMRIMTRMGRSALEHLGDSPSFVRGLHSLGDLSPERRFICHFPEKREIWSVGSGYGGNALLGKKCFALRIASCAAREEGWLAEHMLILGIEAPDGKVSYILAAFPSACGKTNLAMLVPPPSQREHKVWTVGDDIAWLRFDARGQLRAINPESGYFGVVPGTSSKTNPNAMATIRRNTIYTNVAVTPDGIPWWEGKDGPVPETLTDWRGETWSPAGGQAAAHPNSRFTAPARQCPSISSHWEDPEGVPVDAIVFGGRRSRLAPLVFEARSWQHGVYVGACMASETTAAATGAVGEVRRDPMAMRPFCGYNVGSYLRHWLDFGKGRSMPKIFQVNWFRKDAAGNWLWPGFGENLRVLRWIIERAGGKGKAVESPIGWLPAPGAIDTRELDLPASRLEELLKVSRDEWLEELADQEKYLDSLGSLVPAEVRAELAATRARFQ
jgi:phosphoenolpyruvate carboxykinase (GTP)